MSLCLISYCPPFSWFLKENRILTDFYNLLCREKSRDREREREREREKDKKRDREEDEEDAYERRKLERKLREKEAAYQEVN